MPAECRLLVLGYGYVADRLAGALVRRGWQVAGTTRSAEKAARMAEAGVFPIPFPISEAMAELAAATHVLASMAPGEDGDPALALHRAAIAAARPRWIGYLSSTAVYGDTDGGWVDETTPPAPGTERGRRRIAAEAAWRELGAHVFRLPGIYGPGRSALDQVRAGTARRIDKPGHVFCRIHVDDIVGALLASMRRPVPGAVYNVADDLPAPQAEVVAHAAGLLGVPPPPLEPYDEASLSPMARTFWQGCRRVSNAKAKRELGLVLRHPDYRSGLAAILAGEDVGLPPAAVAPA